jgi:hypothetical protein
MSKTWLQFYKAFLAAPVRFPGDLEPCVRKRGTQISYALSVLCGALSVLCGEAVIFLMDLAINQRANGLFLRRMHDDLWLWDTDANLRWLTVAGLVGLKFSQKKTGSAFVGPASEVRFAGDSSRLTRSNRVSCLTSFQSSSERLALWIIRW